MGTGIDTLRRKRGDQDVKFSQVADHFVDYAERNPEDAAVLDRLAGFLANVEDIPHDHSADPDRGMRPEAG